MEFLQNLLGRCEYKKINGNRKTTSFGVELDEREEEKGSKEIYQVGGRKGMWEDEQEGGCQDV